MKGDVDNQCFVRWKLLLFINAAKDDVDKSSKWIHLYYKMKRNAPEFFTNRDVLSDELKHALDNQIFLTLPTTPDNRSTFLHKLRNCDPKTYNFDGSIKTFCMMAGESADFESQ